MTHAEIQALIARNEQLRAALAAELIKFQAAFSPATVPAPQPTTEPAGGVKAGKETSWKP